MNEGRALRKSMMIALGFTGLLWGVLAWEYMTSTDLTFLGIYPRTLGGLVGIATAPLVHGDVQHLLSNTFPLMVLGTGLFFVFRPIAVEVFAIIYLASGFWVWAVGRPAFHIGASGLVYGILSFIFFWGVLKRDVKSLAISMVVLFLYHGLVPGIFPFSDAISWESHLVGGLSGLVCAIYYRKRFVLRAEGSEEEAGTSSDDPRVAGVSAYEELEVEENRLGEGIAGNVRVNFTDTPAKISDDSDLISLN